MGDININNYILNKPLTCDNSGFSKWGIADRAGSKYFIKEFLSPVYPAEDLFFSEEKRNDRIRLCMKYVNDRRRIYEALRCASDGHIVVVEQFFRFRAKYYITTKAILEPVLSIDDIYHDSFEDRIRLICAVSYSVANIHKRKIVHADIKPDNVLVVKKRALIPYIIDFDSSFFEFNRPKPGEELNGDMVYLSPESFLHIAGIESNLNCQLDVFALGLLFHQYLTGELPAFDRNEYTYAYEAVLDDQPLGVDKIKNNICRCTIERMLRKNPEERPEMQVVFETFNKLLLSLLNRNTSDRTAKGKMGVQPEDKSVFRRAGNL